MSLYMPSKEGSSASASDCGVCCANPELANTKHEHTPNSMTIFISDDERDEAVGQPLRLPGKGRRCACPTICHSGEVEESLINGIRNEHPTLRGGSHAANCGC